MKKETKKALKFILIVLFVFGILPVLIIFLGVGWEGFKNSFYNDLTQNEIREEIRYDGLDLQEYKDSLDLEYFHTTIYYEKLCRAYEFEMLEKDGYSFLDSFLEMEDIYAVRDEESHPLSVLFGNKITAFRSPMPTNRSFQWACYLDGRQLTKAEEYENVDVSMIAIYDRDDSLLYIYRYNI